MTVGRSLLAAHNKLCGFSAEELDHLRRARVADYIVVEADGAKGRSLKAHGQYEPVVSAHADLVIAVIGVDCIGKPLNDEYVHRAGRFRKLVNRRMDAPVTIDDISAIVFHPHGYLKGLQPETEVIVFVSKVKSETDRENAGRLAVALQAADSAGRVRHVVIGELAGPSPWLELQSRSP